MKMWRFCNATCNRGKYVPSWRNNSCLVPTYHHDSIVLMTKPVHLQGLYYCLVLSHKSLKVFRLQYNLQRKERCHTRPKRARIIEAPEPVYLQHLIN